ncbi:cupin-like domain-domain-containing protein [Naematelia encephala]|uniref:Cupin-like domain-domain-containing protein n=1 Tax=Naematelia encephala TaxID=71784 RepID=A0A1Y2ATW1_9TREE|nr:cupin-like domain-domain-containing protein [Naematelia encephala]
MADSVRVLNDGSTSFVKPLEEEMSIHTFLHKLTNTDVTEIVYLQSQDGNIYRSTASSSSESNDPMKPQLAALQPYIQRDISWMLDAVGSTAEAVNLWIGSSRSSTSLHHDPYENIYHVLSGSKTFTLISPIEGFWLDQQFHQPSTLQRTSDNNDLKPILDPPPAHKVPWVQSAQFPPTISPLIITVTEGETLFLPSGWWHRVDQQEGSEGLAVAVNYWYTAEIYPDRYAFERFTRRIARESGRDGVIPNPEDLEEDESGHLDDSDGVWDSGVSGEEWDPEDWGR